MHTVTSSVYVYDANRIILPDISADIFWTMETLLILLLVTQGFGSFPLNKPCIREKLFRTPKLPAVSSPVRENTLQ